MRRCALVSFLAVAACTDDADRPGRAPAPTDNPGAIAPDPGDTPPPPPPDSPRARARRAESHLINYGGWDAAAIATAQAHDVVVVYPGLAEVDRALIQTLQEGGDHRVIVLCYVAAGEDLRTAHATDEQLASDPRFRGDGSGPRVDPRGPHAAGMPLDGIDPRGAPSPGGAGYASWYLDDNDHDGHPDRNRNFHGAFVNAGDPAWFDALDAMTVDGPDRLVGLREALTTDTGRGLGCDGVFLDAFDTAAPDGWTGPASSNETESEWTAPGFSAFVAHVRAAYPSAVIAMNRGLFFFNPANPQYRFRPRGLLDLVIFESYRLNSAPIDNPNPFFSADNRYNFMPRLMAEANRDDGFRVLSLGYAAGAVSPDTLVGRSSVGYESLLEDIRVTEEEAGFRHYLSTPAVTLVNRFVLDHASRDDALPPVWSSTWNDGPRPPAIPTAPTPRVGVQQVVPGPGALTVRWDVALDRNRVSYALDLATSPDLAGATRMVLDGRPPDDYAGGVGPGVYANQATIGGLTPGVTYYLRIRAFDDTPAHHEDANDVVLSAAPE